MKVLLTGGAGFIGSYVASELARKYKVCVLDSLTYAGNRERVSLKDFHQVDIINDREINLICDAFEPQVIVNIAAESHVDTSICEPSLFLKTNILGTQVLLDQARKHGAKFVQFSTDEVYGDILSGCFTHDDPLRPSNPYSASKASADLLCQAYQRTYGIRLQIIRSCNNYGPWQHPEKFIPKSILRVLEGKPIEFYGSGKAVREWLYVKDCAKGVLEVVSKPRQGIYHLCSGNMFRNIDIAHLITNQIGGKIKRVKDRPGHDHRYALEPTEDLKWEPTTDFETGFRETVDWYIQNRDLVKKLWT